MPSQYQFERLAHAGKLGVLERALGKGGSVAGGEQQLVALAKGHAELLGDPQQHLAPGLRAPGLDEAEMARGHARVQRELELRHAASLAKFTQQRADVHGRGRAQGLHRRSNLLARDAALHYLEVIDNATAAPHDLLARQSRQTTRRWRS